MAFPVMCLGDCREITLRCTKRIDVDIKLSKWFQFEVVNQNLWVLDTERRLYTYNAPSFSRKTSKCTFYIDHVILSVCETPAKEYVVCTTNGLLLCSSEGNIVRHITEQNGNIKYHGAILKDNHIIALRESGGTLSCHTLTANLQDDNNYLPLINCAGQDGVCTDGMYTWGMVARGYVICEIMGEKIHLVSNQGNIISTKVVPRSSRIGYTDGVRVLICSTEYKGRILVYNTGQEIFECPQLAYEPRLECFAGSISYNEEIVLLEEIISYIPRYRIAFYVIQTKDLSVDFLQPPSPKRPQRRRPTSTQPAQTQQVQSQCPVAQPQPANVQDVPSLWPVPQPQPENIQQAVQSRRPVIPTRPANLQEVGWPLPQPQPANLQEVGWPLPQPQPANLQEGGWPLPQPQPANLQEVGWPLPQPQPANLQEVGWPLPQPQPANLREVLSRFPFPLPQPANIQPVLQFLYPVTAPRPANIRTGNQLSFSDFLQACGHAVDEYSLLHLSRSRSLNPRSLRVPGGQPTPETTQPPTRHATTQAVSTPVHQSRPGQMQLAALPRIESTLLATTPTHALNQLAARHRTEPAQPVTPIRHEQIPLPQWHQLLQSEVSSPSGQMPTVVPHRRRTQPVVSLLQQLLADEVQPESEQIYPVVTTSS